MAPLLRHGMRRFPRGRIAEFILRSLWISSWLIGATVPGAFAADLYFTDFESFPVGANQLGGREGWVTSNTIDGVTGIIDLGAAGTRAAFIGLAPTLSTSMFVWCPINYDPIAAGTPVMQFRVDLQIIDDGTTAARDDFLFYVYNLQGEALGGIEFSNRDQRIYRHDDLNRQATGTFSRNVRQALVATIDFGTNRWSMTVNGTPLFTHQPLTATTRALTLGDIDAAWFVATPGSPGNNFMAFDNYRIATVVRHSADTNHDFTISLFELTRVIELYNTRNGTVRTGCYKVDATNPEDGFAADPSRTSGSTVTLARYHSADTRGATTGSPRDGAIDLFELTRVIELYNTRAGTVRTGAYHVQGGTEDGFAAGP